MKDNNLTCVEKERISLKEYYSKLQKWDSSDDIKHVNLSISGKTKDASKSRKEMEGKSIKLSDLLKEEEFIQKYTN
jgi:hypothetical protein